MPEIIRPIYRERPIRVAVIDFDGTLSLLRSGWVEIMVDMMFEVLHPLPGTTESDTALTNYITDFVLNLNGRPTIYQMDYFVNEARQRGGDPRSAEFYTQQFLNTLNSKAEQRMLAIKSRETTTEDQLIPGARAFLTELQMRGVQLTLASGTPVVHVKHEAEQLGSDHFFEGRIFGPGEKSREFSKLDVMKQTVSHAKCHGAELLGVGDGFVEIENAKEIGGIAIGCASDEVDRNGRIEDWKRTRLIQAGADIIVPDYSNLQKLMEILFPKFPFDALEAG